MVTFGIVTDGNNEARVGKIIGSIILQAIPEFEIIVVGGESQSNEALFRRIPFDETIHPGWITRKKNIITQEAKYNIVVYMHDYVALANKWWWTNFNNFSLDWDVCMHQILNKDGTRYRDWCTWDDDRFGTPWVCHEKWCPPEGIPFAGSPALVPYDYAITHRMYISGAYWVAKKRFMEKVPLDESIYWGEGEDVEWTLRIRNWCRYKMNPGCQVKLLKQKPQQFPVV